MTLFIEHLPFYSVRSTLYKQVSLKSKCLQIPAKLVYTTLVLAILLEHLSNSLEAKDEVAIEGKEAISATRGSKRLVCKSMGSYGNKK